MNHDRANQLVTNLRLYSRPAHDGSFLEVSVSVRSWLLFECRSKSFSGSSGCTAAADLLFPCFVPLLLLWAFCRRIVLMNCSSDVYSWLHKASCRVSRSYFYFDIHSGNRDRCLAVSECNLLEREWAWSLLDSQIHCVFHFNCGPVSSRVLQVQSPYSHPKSSNMLRGPRFVADHRIGFWRLGGFNSFSSCCEVPTQSSLAQDLLLVNGK